MDVCPWVPQFRSDGVNKRFLSLYCFAHSVKGMVENVLCTSLFIGWIVNTDWRRVDREKESKNQNKISRSVGEQSLEPTYRERNLLEWKGYESCRRSNTSVRSKKIQPDSEWDLKEKKWSERTTEEHDETMQTKHQRSMYALLLQSYPIQIITHDGSIGSDTGTNQDQVLLYVEVDQVLIGYAFGFWPHSWFVSIPVFTRSQDFLFDSGRYLLEGLWYQMWESRKERLESERREIRKSDPVPLSLFLWLLTSMDLSDGSFGGERVTCSESAITSREPKW